MLFDDLTQEEWDYLVDVLINDPAGPYYGRPITRNTELEPGYIMSRYASGDINADLLTSFFEIVDPNGNIFDGLLNQFGVADRYAEETAPEEEPLTQWQQSRDFIVSQVESGSASQEQQNWYNRWVASGSPDTQDGMLSADDYRWQQDAQTIIDRVESGNNVTAAEQRWYDKWKASGSPDSKDGMWSDAQYDEWLAEQPEDPVDPVDPGPEPPQTLDDLLSEIAEEQQVDRDVVDGVVDMIETIKGSIPTDLESASDLIKGVLSSTVLGSAIEECESWTGNTTTEGGRGVPSWTKCVDVGIFGIPGLDLPLPPGMVDISTSVYDIIQKGEDIGESFEDFLEDPSGWLENVIDKAVEKVQEVWGDLQSGVDPKTIGGLSGILNDWIGNILGGYILGQVKDATSAIDPFLYAGDCLDPTFKEANKDFCEDALNEGALVDCSAQFGKTGGLVASEAECGTCEDPDFTPTGPNGTCVDPDPNDCAGQNKALKSDGTCGECLDTSQKDFGQGCVAVCEYDESLPADSPDCKEPWTDDGDTEEECAAQGRLHVPGDASTETDSACGDCLPTHTDEDGTCTEWTDGGPTEEECTEQNRVYRPSTGTGRDSSCGGCSANYELINGKCEEEGFEPPCPGNQVRNEETRECEDPPPAFVVGDPCTTEDGKAGTYDSEGVCVPDWENTGPSVQDCEALGKTHVSGDPSAQKPSECGGCKNSTWNPIGAEGECVAPVECWDGSTKPTEAECPEEPPKVDCAADNRIQEDEYTCGGCLNDTFEEIGGECVQKVCDESTFKEEVTETTTVPYGTAARPQAPTYTEINGVCTKTIYEVVVADPTQSDCEAEGKVLGEGEESNTCVEIPVEETCTNGAIDAPECKDCGDGSTPDQHEDNDCGKPLTVKPDNCGPDTFTQERTVEVSVGSGEPQEPTTQYTVEDGACTKVTTVYVQGPTMGPQNCADGKPPAENIGECVECPEGSQYPNASSSDACGAPPQECNAETATKTVNLTETIPFGDPLPDPTTTYEDDGTQCVATTTTYVQGENPCATIDDSNYDECGYDKCEEGSESPYVKDGVECIASVVECTDPNRNTNEDGSCAEGCKEGYRLQPGEGGETLCLPPQFTCWDNTLAFTESECSEEPQIECWDGQIVNDLSKCSEEPPKVDCAAKDRVQVTPYECGGCLTNFEYEGECYDCTTIDENNFRACNGVPCGNGVFAKTQEECPSTDVCSGDGLYPEEGEECVLCPANTPNAGKSMSTLAACGEPVVVDPECDDENITPENAEACGKQLCNGVYIDIELPCVPVLPPEGCEDPEEVDFGTGAGCEKPCPDNANIGISDAACGDTGTVCLDETANNFNEEGPCDFGPVEDICENGAIDYPECTECADGSLPDFETGCAEGPIEDPCDDPVYAAENPTECTSGPNCVDCTCPEYAAANPEECIVTPPPPTGGGGGGGGGDQGKIEPIEIGISGDPELLARQEFPITDYLSGLFTGRR